MSDAPGPGPLVGAHRLLIASALLLAIVFAVHSARAYWATGAAASGGMAAAGLLFAVVLSGYLWTLRGLAARLTPRDPHRH